MIEYSFSNVTHFLIFLILYILKVAFCISCVPLFNVRPNGASYWAINLTVAKRGVTSQAMG